MKSTAYNAAKDSCDTLRIHFRDVKKIPLLEPEQEAELAEKAKRGDASARERLLTSNMRFVIKIAKRYQNCGLELEDLISEGYIGLIEALSHFDEKKGYHFISYAVWWIRQSILKAICDKGRAIRLPSNKVAELSRIEDSLKEVGADASKSEMQQLEEVAAMLGMTNYHVREMLNISRTMASIETPVSESGEFLLGDTIASEYKSPLEEAEDSILKSDIDKVLSELDEKTRAVIRLRYGLDGKGSRSLKEIGEKFSLSKERVRQIEKRGMEKISTLQNKNRLRDYFAA